MQWPDKAQPLEAPAPVLRGADSKQWVTAQRASSTAAPPSNRSKARKVAIRRATEKVTRFLALPRGAGRHGAIIVIHEWWGLTEWVKQQAVKLAANGYVALAVDLYRGKVTADPSEARKLRRALRQEHAIGDLKAAFDYLAGRPDIDAKHICSLGWSMGGGLALQLAIHEPRLAACVVNYGALPTNPADINKINAPVLAIFGSRERGISPDKIRAFKNSMTAAGKRIEIEVYADAGHAFESPTNESGYRPEAASDAWVRTLKFFEHAKESKSAVS